MEHFIWRWCLCLFAVVAISACGLANHDNSTNLTFMMIISFGQFGFNSSGALPAAEMALEHINMDPDVLPGYNLVYDRVRDSQCHRGRSLDTFFNGIQSKPVKIAVVGCGCSVATEPVAEISYQWNISQISFSSGSPALSDRTRFRKYFRNSATSEIVAPTLRSVTAQFNWTRVTVITQEEALFTIAESLFRQELGLINITVASRMFRTGDNPIETEDLFAESEDYRVFMLNTYSGPARRIIFEALMRNYTYPRYAWITYHWYPRQWWTRNVTNIEVECTDAELERFLERVLTLQTVDDATESDVGITLAGFEQEYAMRAAMGRYNTVDVRFRIYDAMWALALALNETMTMVNTVNTSETGCEAMEGSLVPLQEFDYNNALMSCLIQWNLQRTDFSGVSGQVKFDVNGTLIQTRTALFQYQYLGDRLVRKRIADLETFEDFKFTYEPGVNETLVYPDGIPPDGSSEVVTNTFKVWTVVVFYILASFGVAFATGCLLFNLIFRKRRLIKLSSPKINYFIIAGAVLMYVSIYFYLLPVTSGPAVQAICIIEHWLFTIGYSLAFGGVLAKMWRVYQIFNNPKLNKKVFKDWHLVIFILIITGIAMFLVVLEIAIPKLRGSVTHVRDQEQPEGRTPLNVSIEFYVMVCYEELSPTFFWQILIFVYLAVLQIIGLLLAIQTRKVKLHGLRDSKFIAAIIYASSIVLVVLALVTFSLRSYINIGTGISAFGILTLTTLFLSLIFFPKMVMLYRDPTGESVGTIPSTSPALISSVTQSTTSNTDEKIMMLEKAITEKENRINELTYKIKALMGNGPHNGHENQHEIQQIEVSRQLSDSETIPM